MASRSGQKLRDTVGKLISEKKIRELQATCEELRTELADKTERAEDLEDSLAICERDRERNFNTALQLYANTGNLVLVERQNLFDHIRQLNSHIWQREQDIENLQRDLELYASQPKWDQMRQCFFGLQQEYGRMPQELRDLTRKYEDLEEEHIEVSNRLKWLEGSYTEVKAQCDQVREERDPTQ